MRVGLSVALLACATGALSGQVAQQSTPATAAPAESAQGAGTEALKPGALYKAATHPLEVVRGSLDNWSEAELGALAVGIRMAAEGCAKARPEAYSGDDLYDLARLCSMGQSWADANNAAVRYMDSRAEPHRAQAYALSINAQVHLKMEQRAFETAVAMLRDLPFDAEVAYAIRYVKDVLEREGKPEATALSWNEHQMLLDALQKGAPLNAVHGDAVMGVGALYESAMEKAFWERFNGDDEGAGKTAAECDAALVNTAALPPEDRERVESVRAQYNLLGSKLPEIGIVSSLQGEKAKSQIDPSYGAATVLVLFPDWCAQCRNMMKPLTEFAKMNADTPLHAYGLMSHDEADAKAPASHGIDLKDLQETQTLIISAATAQNFGVLDFPTAIVVDGAGVIRFIGAIPTDAFNGDGYIGRVIQRMAVVAKIKSMTPPNPR
jgi:thiol-disulfide isomerase/thioredoxin